MNFAPKEWGGTVVALAHHTTIGDGTPVVMLGSLGSDRSMWDPQVSTLGSDRRVVAVDLRGHGESPTPPGPYRIDDLAADVLELLDALAVPRVHLVGLSLGGAVSQWLARHSGDRVATLTLLCTAAKFGEPQGWLDRAALVRRDGTEAIADAVVARWFTPEFAAANIDLAERARAMVADTDNDGYARCCEAIAAWDFRAELAAITTPTLVIAGAQDPATTPADLGLIAAGIPGATLEIVDPGAHVASLEQPERVSALIAAHLEAQR